MGQRCVSPLVPEPVNSSRECELGGPEPCDEVAPPHLTPVLELLEHWIHTGKPAFGSLGQRHLAGHDPVPLQQLKCPGGGDLG